MIGCCTILPKVAQKGSAASLGSSQVLGHPKVKSLGQDIASYSRDPHTFHQHLCGPMNLGKSLQSVPQHGYNLWPIITDVHQDWNCSKCSGRYLLCNVEITNWLDIAAWHPIVRWYRNSPVWHPKRGEHEPGMGNILSCWLHILTTAIRRVSALDPKAHSYMHA